jgi:GntR family transcriptional regulator
VYHNYETVDLAFFKINPASGVPIYLQLMDRFRHAIESCLLAPGDQLPGIRTLAQQLVISPNTVVKAYTELDREGVIELRHGAGTFVLDRERHRDRIKEVRAAHNLVRTTVEKLRKQGFASDEIRRFVDAELNLDAEEVRSGY